MWSNVWSSVKTTLQVLGLMRKNDSQYARADYVESLIRDNQWRQVLNDNNDPRVVDINLRQDPVDVSVLGYQFKLRWGNLMERGCPLILFFPNHPDKDLQILRTAKASSLAVMDKDIQSRLAESTIQVQDRNDGYTPRNVGNLLLAIASGNYLYRVWGIDKNHNIYLYWLTHLNIYNAMGQCGPPRLKIPTLAEFDGYGKPLNIVPLDFQPRPDHDARILEPLNLRAHKRTYIRLKRRGETLFNLERDTRQAQHRKIVTTSDSSATNDVLAMSVTNVLHTINAEELPLDEPLDSESLDMTPGNAGVHYAHPSPASSDYINTDDDEDYIIEETFTITMKTPRGVPSGHRSSPISGTRPQGTGAHIPNLPLGTFVPDEPPAHVENDNHVDSDYAEEDPDEVP